MSVAGPRTGRDGGGVDGGGHPAGAGRASLYDELGADHGIGVAVGRFYDRVVSDPRLRRYFEGVDLERLRAHQTALLAQVTGGPQRYDGRSLTAAHAGLGITAEAFDRVVAHLAATLTDLGVDPGVVDAVGGALRGHRDEIVSAPATAV